MGQSIVISQSINKYQEKEKWLAQSKPLENPLEEKHQGSSLQLRLLEKALLQLEEQRSHIDTGQEQQLSVKSEDTKNLLSYCYASYHSNVWFVKLRKISRQIFGSNLAQSCAARSFRGLLGWSNGGYQLVCHPCQASDDNAKGHSIGSSHPWRKSLTFLSIA